MYKRKIYESSRSYALASDSYRGRCCTFTQEIMETKYLKSYFQKDGIEAGCDEAGRGCLAGPVYAAAVILPKKFKHKLLDDSKKLTHAQRLELRTVIEKKAISYSIARLTHKEIDRYNILNASLKAMYKAVKSLTLHS